MTFFERFTEGVIGTPQFKFYRKRKSRGGYRLIGQPNEAMKEVQTRLKNFFGKVAPRFHNAAASRGNLGSVRNARHHLGSDCYFKLDFSHAFDSTNGRRLAEIIATRIKKVLRREPMLPTTDEWFKFLSTYCLTRRGGLIQGAGASSILIDWYCEEIVDRPLRKFLRRALMFGWLHEKILYTRYVDDLEFSSKIFRISKWTRRCIRQIIASAGYLENHWKTEVADILINGTVKITGLRVGKGDHVGVPRKKVKEMERMLEKALAMPLFSKKPEVIQGKITYLLDVLRGKKEINKLEARTLSMYREWCQRNGKDDGWVTKVLATKSVKKTVRMKKRHKKQKVTKFPDGFQDD